MLSDMIAWCLQALPMTVDLCLLYHLKSKEYQNRTVGFIENGSWAPMSGKLMKEQMAAMKNINIIEDVVTVKSALKAADEAKLEELADKLMD